MSQPRLIAAYILTSEKEADWQARAAAVASAMGDGLVLDGAPTIKRQKINGRWYFAYTWQTVPMPRLEIPQ